jgi:hypothetical protein
MDARWRKTVVATVIAALTWLSLSAGTYALTPGPPAGEGSAAPAVDQAFFEQLAGGEGVVQLEDLITRAVPNVTLSADGTLTLVGTAGLTAAENAGLRAQFADINTHLREFKAHPAHRVRAPVGAVTAGAWWCFWVYVPKWAMRAFAWTIIVAGGVTATAALFVSGTIVGLPAGAVLGALGIWVGITGGALLWWVDNYYASRWVRVCL